MPPTFALLSMPDFYLHIIKPLKPSNTIVSLDINEQSEFVVVGMRRLEVVKVFFLLFKLPGNSNKNSPL